MLLMRSAFLLVSVLLLTGCGGSEVVEKDSSARRTLEPARILVGPDGRVLLVGIARLLGEGHECGNERQETAEFVAARLQPAGEVSAVLTVPQEEIEWCAERVDEAVILPDGGFAVGGPIYGAPESEGSSDRGFVAARFTPTGEPGEIAHVTYPTTQLAAWLLGVNPPLDDEQPELRGLAQVAGGRLVLGKYQTGFPNYTLFMLGKKGHQLGRTLVHTKTETAVLGVEASRHGIYVLTEEFPIGEGTDYRYGLYRHSLGGRLAEKALVDPGRSRFEVATDFALQDDGGVLVAGELDRGRTRMLFVTRRNPSGAIDRSWGKDGLTLLALGRLAADDNLYTDSRAAVGILPDGKVLVAGSIRGRPAKVFRLDAKGLSDKAFGEGGSVTLKPL